MLFPILRATMGKRELFDAMAQIVPDGTSPAGQMPSIGRSIKWKAD